jgi:hypothetical protein
MYEAAFANGIESLLPSTTSLTGLITAGKLPQAFLFEGTAPSPQFAPFFGTPNLIRTSYRTAVLQDAAVNGGNPQHPLRQAAYRNDLLQQNWTPAQPMLLCGGNADPTVFFNVNTLGAQAYFADQGVPGQAVKVLDVDSTETLNDGFDALRAGFTATKNATAANAGSNAASVVAQAYHGTLVPPFCNAAARGYFAQF